MSAARTIHSARQIERSSFSAPSESRGRIVVPSADQRAPRSSASVLDGALLAEIDAIASQYHERDYRDFEFDVLQRRIFEIEAES